MIRKYNINFKISDLDYGDTGCAGDTWRSWSPSWAGPGGLGRKEIEIRYFRRPRWCWRDGACRLPRPASGEALGSECRPTTCSSSASARCPSLPSCPSNRLTFCGGVLGFSRPGRTSLTCRRRAFSSLAHRPRWRSSHLSNSLSVKSFQTRFHREFHLQTAAICVCIFSCCFSMFSICLSSVIWGKIN